MDKNKCFIVVKNYSDSFAKRQPWYSLKKIMLDLEEKNYVVNIISSEKLIPNDFGGLVFYVWGLKNLFIFPKSYSFKLIYIITFPIYPLKKFSKIPITIFWENRIDLIRIFLVSLTPKFLINKSLKHAEKNIVISDRSFDYLRSLEITNVHKYIPFRSKNWGLNISEPKTRVKESYTLGYFGPPFSIRGIGKVVNFFEWLERRNIQKYKKKFIIRTERPTLLKLGKKYLTPLKQDTKTKIIYGMLSREMLYKELLDIDYLFLPFEVVFSELPIVVLEALELGITVVTTEDSGIKNIAKHAQNILILTSFDKDKYLELEMYLQKKKEKKNESQVIMDRINLINYKTLDLLCQN